jgi:hypothetical protein
MIPLDPMAALNGLQSAISMVKKASKVANDIAGLAPMIGKMFDAKSTATKAMIEAKKGGGSNMGAALQIEMALDEANRFEEQLKMLFMQAGRIDVFNKAKERAQLMDAENAKEIRKLREQEKKQKEAEEEQMTYLIAGLAVVLLITLVAFGLSEIGDMCAKTKCGR